MAEIADFAFSLHDLSLYAEKRRAVEITTLLRMIAGLETPDDGEIRLDGTCGFSKERKIDLPPEERNLGFVFQDFAL